MKYFYLCEKNIWIMWQVYFKNIMCGSQKLNSRVCYSPLTLTHLHGGNIEHLVTYH
jgi:hypothetical protein